MLVAALAQEEQLRQQSMAYTKKTFNPWPVWCHQRGSRATTADTSTTGSAYRVHLASDRKVCVWGFVFVWGGARAWPWVSRRGASFQHAYFSPKYPYLPDLVFNNSLFQVQHRLDYLQYSSQPPTKRNLNELLGLVLPEYYCECKFLSHIFRADEIFVARYRCGSTSR